MKINCSERVHEYKKMIMNICLKKMVYRYLEMMQNVLQTVQTQIRKEQSDLGDQSDLEQSDPVCISLSVSKFRK